jgi:hypothetical protein
VNTLKLILKTLGDFFLDHNGDGDEKRLLGIGLVVFACVYIAAIKPGDLAGFLGIAGVGTGLLGLGVVGDQVNKTSSSSSNSSAGIPGS